eukprot:564476-Hanusia_phi.AAC.5
MLVPDSSPLQSHLLQGWLARLGLSEESVMFVCDGDWDLRSMLPRQCELAEVPQPPVLQRWVDVRRVFSETLKTGSKVSQGAAGESDAGEKESRSGKGKRVEEGREGEEDDGGRRKKSGEKAEKEEDCEEERRRRLTELAQAHSGICDARNIARVGLVLMQVRSREVDMEP